MSKQTGIPPIPIPEIERLLTESAPSIWFHIALIALGDAQVFSGVYARSHGYEGILTAGHSAEQFLERDSIALVVSEVRHKLIVHSKSLEHLRIGYDEVEGYASGEPDLSFVVIKDQKLLRLIRDNGVKFYDLDIAHESVRDVFMSRERPMAKFNWSVGGCPREKVEITEQVIDGYPHRIISSPTALIQGNLVEWEMEKEFDCLKLFLGSGFEKFPFDYNGMSGGGIWYQRFQTDDGNNFSVKPMLAGVARYQSEVTDKKGYKVRCITGHGWISIYGHVRKALAEKRAGTFQGPAGT